MASKMFQSSAINRVNPHELHSVFSTQGSDLFILLYPAIPDTYISTCPIQFSQIAQFMFSFFIEFFLFQSATEHERGKKPNGKDGGIQKESRSFIIKGNNSHHNES